MRRSLLLILAIAFVLGPAAAQAPGKIYKIGVLTHGYRLDRTDATYRRAVENARMFGFEEDRNVQMHWAAAEGDNGRLPMLARQLVEKHVDIIVVIGDVAALAVKKATTEIPVVMVAGDPVGSGLVESLARPGGNLTGVAVYGSEADSKRIEMLVEHVGQGKKIAYLVDATVGPVSIQKVEQAAASLKVELVVFRVGGPSDYDAVFRAMQDAGVDALLFGTSLEFLMRRGDLAARAAAARLPTMCHWREMAQAGCLLTFGTNLEWVFGRVVDYVIRIAGFGQKPGDLAIEQASKFELIINMKTARALGATIPDRLAARADDVLE